MPFSDVTMGLQKPAAVGEAKTDPFLSHIRRDGELGAHFLNPARA